MALAPLLLLASALTVVTSGLNLADVPCGKVSRGSRMFHARIMGGRKIHITDFPHAVSLRKNGQHFCGGALISERFVITAAHCVHSHPAEVWTAVIGEQNSNSKEDHEQQLKVEEIIKHPMYTFPKFIYDLALIKLEKPVEWTQYAQPVCLPDSGRRTGRGLGYLAGWGYDAESKRGGSPTEELHFVKLPIIENQQCQEWFHSQGKRITMKPEHLCAGYEHGQTDGCQGDSGGGLVALDEEHKLVLVGVMSAGIGCGRERLPGVYTRVEKFVSWVEEVVKEHKTDANIARM